jgi:hypothetical protein
MARTGVARFAPKVAIAMHREFFTDVINRTDMPLRQGLLELREHNSLLTTEDALALVKRRADTKAASEIGYLSKQDGWIVSQYQLLLAFPFLTAREQTEILMSDTADEKVLLKLLDVAKPLSEAEYEIFLETACHQGSERNQHILLALGKNNSVQLSPGTRKRIAALFRSESERVRAEALAVIANSGDEELLGQVANSDWNAVDGETEDSFESWYGSAALLAAASRGLIAHHEVVERISPSLYGQAATILETDAVRDIAQRIDASIRQAAGLEGDLIAPVIEVRVQSADPYEPNRFSVSERASASKGIEKELMRFLESKEAHEQRQKHNYDAYLEFRSNLTQRKARIILDCLSFKGFEAVVTADERLADRWHELFMDIAVGKLPTVHNLILFLAQTLGKNYPRKAEALFSRVKGRKPLVRFTFSRARVELDAEASWAGERSPVLDELRFARLDLAETDHDLALEVLAAQLNGQYELVTEYIEAKLKRDEPAEIARAIMVAGFSDQSEFNDEVLTRYQGSDGLVGSAHRAAKYAYERNIWARHWFAEMCQTAENTGFWRYAVLFSKIVDGRFEVWEHGFPQRKAPFELFGPSITDQIGNRFKRWETHRKKKLFGDDAPEPIFLEIGDLNGC